ncbi:MAG: hypothetical protein O7C75_05915 [Verrucomicrobia bacterium]|nr:hypothetical protein [Verrucomicrobiota bacterium]
MKRRNFLQLAMAASQKDGMFEVRFRSTKPLEKAVLISTADTGFTGNREWVESSASLEPCGNEWIAKVPLPVGSNGWFVNVRSGNLTASSNYQESLLH